MNWKNLLHNSIENCFDSYCAYNERIKYQQNDMFDIAVNKVTSHAKLKQNVAQ